MRKRTSGLLVVAALLAGCAGEPVTPEECLARVDTLRDAVRQEKGFQEVFAAYKEVQAGLESVEGDEEGRCAASYEAIQASTEEALRRDNLSLMGWITGFFAASVLWGGFWVCVAIAAKRHQIEEVVESAEAEEV